MAESTESIGSPLRFPSWQREYEAALAEQDGALFRLRIEVAEAAVLGRLGAILKEGDEHNHEREAIEDVLIHLQLLRKTRLRSEGTRDC